jgi:hypothetical protein
MPVLHIERLIESQGLAQLFDLTGSGSFSELLARIAGHNVNEQKNQGQHQPKGLQGEQEAMQEMARHSSAGQRSFSRDLDLDAARTGFGGEGSPAAALSG